MFASNRNNSVFVAALILAGGKSSRMGRDKALVLWENVPLLQRVCQVASECCQEVYILTPWPDRYQIVLKKGYNFLIESNPDRGPLVGLAEGITRINANWVLLLACDLPLLDSTIIESWVSQLSQLPDDVLAFVPKQGELWQPLCGFYRYEALPELDKFIQQGGSSFQSWLDRVSVRIISVSDREAQMLYNCNTPADLK